MLDCRVLSHVSDAVQHTNSLRFIRCTAYSQDGQRALLSVATLVKTIASGSRTYGGVRSRSRCALEVREQSVAGRAVRAGQADAAERSSSGRRAIGAATAGSQGVDAPWPR